MAGIFLSYRREDTAGYSGRLADALRESLGENVIFRDVDTISPGIDFVQAITRAVEDADVLLAVIGRRWLTAKDSQRRRRIDDPKDYVRLEITSALELGRKVLPVLVDGARLPKPEAVPEPLRPLLRRQALELTDSRWTYDLGVLLDDLRQTLPRIQEQAAPVEERPAPATRRPLRFRLGLLGLLSALLVGGLLAGLLPTRQPSQMVPARASATEPTTTAPAPSSSSSIPETTATSVATSAEGGGVVVTRSTIPPMAPPIAAPTNPPPTSPPQTTTPPTTAAPPLSYPYGQWASDRAVGAHKTADGKHYVARKVATGEILFTTHPQHVGDPNDANNDVKAAKFCSGGNRFAATYHYWGGTSIYSWIGYWSTATGQFVHSQRAEGQVYSLDPFC